jgi:hypothetical protein
VAFSVPLSGSQHPDSVTSNPGTYEAKPKIILGGTCRYPIPRIQTVDVEVYAMAPVAVIGTTGAAETNQSTVRLHRITT